MGALAGLEQREEVRRGDQGARRRGTDRVRRPREGRSGGRRRRARRVPVADPAGRRPGAGRAARGRGVRAGVDRAALHLDRAARRAAPRAARAAWRARSSPPTRRSRARSCSASRPGTGGCSCSTARTRRSRRATARRCRSSCTAAPVARAAARSWAGIRGVLHHMQRTAVQADPDTLAAITGRWVAGSARTDDRRAPVPQAPRGAVRSATRSSPARARSPRRTSSTSPSSPATRSTRTWTPRPRPTNPIFGERVAHGYLTLAFAAGLFVDPDPGPVLANYGLDNLRFLTPVKFGDELTVTLTCKQITPRGSRPTARCAGTPTSRGRTASPWPATTCSRSSRARPRK